MMDWSDDYRNGMETAPRRQPAVRPAVRVPFHEGGEVRPSQDMPPAVLSLETTDQCGLRASWMDDTWWLELVSEWSDDPLTVKIEATPDALLNPVTLYQLGMLRRVGVRWHLVGYVQVSDLAREEELIEIARSPYHEVRFIETITPLEVARGRTVGPWNVDEVFGRIRAAQQAANTRSPILVRVSSGRRTDLGPTTFEPNLHQAHSANETSRS